jgi:hypothetical protein
MAVRWVSPPSLLSMAPNRSIRPARTALAGISLEANQSPRMWEIQADASRFSPRLAAALPKRFNRR